MSKLGLYSVTLSEYNSHCLQLLTINASKSKRVSCGAAVQQYIEWISRYAGFSHIAMSLCVCLTRKRSRNVQSAHILGLAPCSCWQRVLFNASVRWRTLVQEHWWKYWWKVENRRRVFPEWPTQHRRDVRHPGAGRIADAPGSGRRCPAARVLALSFVDLR